VYFSANVFIKHQVSLVHVIYMISHDEINDAISATVEVSDSPVNILALFIPDTLHCSPCATGMRLIDCSQHSSLGFCFLLVIH